VHGGADLASQVALVAEADASDTVVFDVLPYPLSRVVIVRGLFDNQV
jgi:hypothetical protein